MDARVVTLMPIKKMDRAIKFYTKSLGAKVVERARGEMKDMWAGLNLAGHDVWLIVPEKREKRKLSYTNLLVKDIKATVKELKRNGVKFEKAPRMSKETRVEGPIAWESFGGSAFFKDSEGNLLMVWQNIPPM
jgi:catechol 2,3-dioxygenase-like lactoylglutathione lyase family enzyme